MKKTILATIAFVALSLYSFAGGKNEDRKLLSDLQTALKTSTHVQWSTKTDYTQASFGFNGKAVSAFYSPEDNSLIGFSIHLDMKDLPKEITDAVNQKYGDWTIVDAILFIDSNAAANYFAQVTKGKNNLALKIVNGKAIIYGRMPS